MKKAIVGFIVLVLLFSCASIRDYQKTYRSELTERDNRLFGLPKSAPSLLTYNDTSLDLLLGLYAFSLIKNPSRYPFYLCNPYIFSPFYSFHDLMVYQSMMESMSRMETFKLSMEAQRILDELKREAAKIKD